VRSKEEWIRLAREEEGDPTTGIDDRPVDARLAEAMGWSHCRVAREQWWGIPPVGHYSELIPERSSDYAWCGEFAELNDLSVEEYYDDNVLHPKRWQASKTLRDLRACEDVGDNDFYGPAAAGWNAAIIEWGVAAIAAGVTVRLPGGRVVNDQA
jgi:hypothetical protein